MMIFILKASIRRKPLRLLSFLLLILGVGLLTTAGNTSLSCDRDTENVIQCSVKRTLSLGIVPKSSETINDVKSVKLDQQIRQIYEKSSEGEPPTARERQAYGILLVGQRQILLNGYDYDRDRQEQRLKIIRAFLHNPNQQQLELEFRNIGVTIVTLLVFSGAIALFIGSQKTTSS